MANVEAGAILRGSRDKPELRALWQLAESWWRHPDAVGWSPSRVDAPREILAPELLSAISAAVSRDRVVHTLSGGKPNSVQDITADGVWVETEKSRSQLAGWAIVRGL